jgi:hypothetical protein
VRLSTAVVLVVTLFAACRKPTTSPAPVNDFPALVAHWAEPTPLTYRARVFCDVPDGGATVSVISNADAWSNANGDCSVSPLACRTTRDEVLRALDAGTLAFPEAQRVKTDAEGWFVAPFESGQLFFVECGASARKYTPSTPTPELTAHIGLESAVRPEFPGKADERVLVINPFTRQVARLSAEEWKTAPLSLITNAWVDAAQSALLRLPGEADSDDAEAEAPPADAGVLAVRVKAPVGVRAAPLDLSLERAGEEAKAFAKATTANGADGFVAPGEYLLKVSMPGCEDTVRPVTVKSGTRTETLITLVAAIGSRGRVVDERGQPVEGACVTFRKDEQWVSRCEARSDRRGEFALPPGEAPRALKAKHPSLGTSREVIAADTAPVVLRLEVRNRLRLNIREPGGKFSSGKVVATASHELLSGGVGVSIGGGPVELTNLAEGRNELTFATPRFFAPPLEVEMPETGTVERDIQLVHLVAIEGVVLRKGRPVAKLGVWRKEPFVGEMTDEQGRFVVKEVPEGAIELGFGHPKAERTLTLRAPAKVEIELTTGSVRELP